MVYISEAIHYCLINICTTSTGRETNVYVFGKVI